MLKCVYQIWHCKCVTFHDVTYNMPNAIQTHTFWWLNITKDITSFCVRIKIVESKNLPKTPNVKNVLWNIQIYILNKINCNICSNYSYSTVYSTGFNLMALLKFWSKTRTVTFCQGHGSTHCLTFRMNIFMIHDLVLKKRRRSKQVMEQ